MYFISNGFTHIEFDSNLYIKHAKDGFTILVVYVDDSIVVGNNNQLIEDFKFYRGIWYELDKGPLNYFLGNLFEEEII